VLRNVRLVLQTQDAPEIEQTPVGRKTFESVLDKVTVEQSGPVRAVIRVEGRHKGRDRAWAPFIVRFYAYAGADSLRMMHTFIFDGDAAKDFVCGLGVTADVPMADELYDRHVRFTGQGEGLWAEAVKPLTGLRRDAGKAFRDAQIAGRKTPPADQMPAPVRAGLHLIPAWGDFLLSQPTADGFTIRKRTAPGHAWIHADGGQRASGVAYVGGARPAGRRSAWAISGARRRPPGDPQRGRRRRPADRLAVVARRPGDGHPLLSRRPGHGDARPGDRRPQHHLRGLRKGLGHAHRDRPHHRAAAVGPGHDPGPRTASRKMARLNDQPPRLMAHAGADPRRRRAGRLGPARPRHAPEGPDRGPPGPAAELLSGQIEQRRWYGFWDYGDLMHSYDVDRHVWRYDIGGFAWDNSELSTDLWLWLSFLRGGRADVFRMAEAMTRHTGEVDVYHVGPIAAWAPGTGCSTGATAPSSPGSATPSTAASTTT
jgi:hypothetical protein